MPISGDDAADFVELQDLGLAGELRHQCVGTDLKKLRAAKGLRLSGLVTIEDSANGPMITRTYRGSELVRKIEQQQ